MHPAPSTSGNAGFTLVEVMVAMVIMTVALLGMLHALNIATDHNLRNHLRDEAVSIADEKLNELKFKPFDNLSTLYGTEQVASRIRGATKTYSVRKTTTAIGTTTRTLAVRVAWSYKNMSSSHELRSVKTR